MKEHLVALFYYFSSLGIPFQVVQLVLGPVHFDFGLHLLAQMHPRMPWLHEHEADLSVR